jgi:hypothetical protein
MRSDRLTWPFAGPYVVAFFREHPRNERRGVVLIVDDQNAPSPRQAANTGFPLIGHGVHDGPTYLSTQAASSPRRRRKLFLRCSKICKAISPNYASDGIGT